MSVTAKSSCSPRHCVALHGFTGCGDDFAALAHHPELINIEWHCPDLPGHGVAAKIPVTPKNMLRAIDEAARALPRAEEAESPQRVLLGYSMGARAALLHAAMHPSAWDALVLISGTAGLRDENERTERKSGDARLAAAMETHGLEWFLTEWQNKPILHSQQNIPKAIRNSLQAKRRCQSVSGLAASLRGFGTGTFPSLWNDLEAMKLPTLLITGVEDTKFTELSRRMQQVLPQATHLALPGLGHTPHLEHLNRFAPALRAWLDKQ